MSYLSFPCCSKTHCSCVLTEKDSLFSLSIAFAALFAHGKRSHPLSVWSVSSCTLLLLSCAQVLEPPGTLAWPTKINCPKARKALGHFSELSKHQLSRMVLLGEVFNYLDNFNYLANSHLQCPFHYSVFCKFLSIAQSFFLEDDLTLQFLQ